MRMTLADFEARYRREPDPWGYTTSAYEQGKYAATLAACGTGPFSQALELGASIGVFSALLAPRCASLTTIDASATAVADARARLIGLDQVHTLLGTIPGDVPECGFDLVIASEILYYLSEAELAATLVTLRARMRPRARLVAVHWCPEGPERPLGAATVHATLRAQPWLRAVTRSPTEDYLLDVLEAR